MAESSSMVLGCRSFSSEENKAAFERFQRCKITISDTLILSQISHPIADLFSTSNLIYILGLIVPFHSKFLFEFFANLIITADRQTLQTRIYGQDFVITSEDFARCLHIPNEGPTAHEISNNHSYNWSHINQLLRNSNVPFHVSSVSDLTTQARAVQHVIRSSLVPKAGDKSKITPLISAVTFFILSRTSFNVTDLIIRNIDYLNCIRDPRNKKKYNLCYGHLFAHILHSKYNFTYPLQPDLQPTYFSDKSFALFFSKRKKRHTNIHDPEEEEGPHEETGEASSQREIAQLRARIEEIHAENNQRWAENNQRWEENIRVQKEMKRDLQRILASLEKDDDADDF